MSGKSVRPSTRRSVSDPGRPVLGYWSLRGLAQFLRYALLHAGVDFEDKQYDVGPAPEFSREEWLKDKDSLGLEFPNLPYYIDGDIKITESSAIGKYIGRKLDLTATTEPEMIRLDMAEGIISDIARSLAMLCYDPDFELKKVAYIDNAGPQIAKLAKLVGTENYIIGEKITWLDFVLVENLERFVALIPNCLDKHTNLNDYMKRIFDLPNIKKYRDSKAFEKIKARFNGPSAKFGSGM